MSIYIQLTGGLGNQLFQYVSASNLAARNNMELILDCRPSQRVLGRRSDLLSFQLQNEKCFSLRRRDFLMQFIDRLCWRLPVLRGLTNRKAATSLASSIFDLNVKSGDKVRGFFQDYNFFEEFYARCGTSSFTISNPTDTFSGLLKIFDNLPTVAVHVRRGDYVTYKSTFGLLSDDYYIGAYSNLSPEQQKSPTYIFSDSPELISSKLSRELNTTRIIGPKDLSPAETLVLMSKAKVLITSNSTFSWWAGAISNECTVIAPKPWFDNLNPWFDTSGLVPEHWERSHSAWEY